MSRKTAFDAHLNKCDDDVRKAIEADADVRTFLENASPKLLSRLADTDPEIFKAVLKFGHDHPAAGVVLPPANVMQLLAKDSKKIRDFLRNVPTDPPHLASARSKIDESHDAVTTWFDDWKGHSTGILGVHKDILDGTLTSGNDLFAALARETIGLYATAFHWLLRPYVKK
jgi:hypothetical protein